MIRSIVENPVAGSFETDEIDAVRAAVASGRGIGILPVYMVRERLRNGDFVPLFRDFRVLPESAIYLLYLPNLTLPTCVRALIQFLTARFGPVPPWEAGL